MTEKWFNLRVTLDYSSLLIDRWLPDFGERRMEKERHWYGVPAPYVFIGRFLFVPWLGLNPQPWRIWRMKENYLQCLFAMIEEAICITEEALFLVLRAPSATVLYLKSLYVEATTSMGVNWRWAMSTIFTIFGVQWTSNACNCGKPRKQATSLWI